MPVIASSSVGVEVPTGGRRRSRGGRWSRPGRRGGRRPSPRRRGCRSSRRSRGRRAPSPRHRRPARGVPGGNRGGGSPGLPTQGRDRAADRLGLGLVAGPRRTRASSPRSTSGKRPAARTRRTRFFRGLEAGHRDQVGDLRRQPQVGADGVALALGRGLEEEVVGGVGDVGDLPPAAGYIATSLLVLKSETDRIRSARSKTRASTACRRGPPKRTSCKTSWLVTASFARRVGMNISDGA